MSKVVVLEVRETRLGLCGVRYAPYKKGKIAGSESSYDGYFIPSKTKAGDLLVPVKIDGRISLFRRPRWGQTTAPAVC